LRPLSRALLAVAVAAVALVFCGAAGAAIVTVGPSLGGNWESEECGISACTFANDDLGGTGPYLVAPDNGVILRWSVVGGETAGTYRLRTMNLGSTDVDYFFQKATASVASVPTAGVQTFATSTPVKAGQAIGLGMSETASVGFRDAGRFTEWDGEPAENTPPPGVAAAGLVGFNAEMQPAPTIASLGTVTGPTAGGTAVAIAGTDFENTTGVSFGGTPATSFKVESEGLLSVVAPASATAATVPVTVTTIAGKVSSAQTFAYEAPPAAPKCVVPKLRGKKLSAARKALRKAQCKTGKVKKLKGARVGSGKVSRQSAKPGAKLPAGTKVNLTLAR
jgi:hypothetical protein